MEDQNMWQQLLQSTKNFRNKISNQYQVSRKNSKENLKKVNS